MHARRGSERGFTMIEVMIAVLLSAIAVIGIIALFVTQSRASGRARHETEAASLANDKLEKLRTVAAPTSGTDPNNPIDAQGNALDAQGNPGIFYRKWDVTSVSGVSAMTVKVGWDDDDVPSTSCSADSACPSNYCTGSTCASYAVSVYGMRL